MAVRLVEARLHAVLQLLVVGVDRLAQGLNHLIVLVREDLESSDPPMEVRLMLSQAPADAFEASGQHFHFRPQLNVLGQYGIASRL
jgi:hypothetical protein